jgi:hypothetical protein
VAVYGDLERERRAECGAFIGHRRRTRPSSPHTVAARVPSSRAAHTFATGAARSTSECTTL